MMTSQIMTSLNQKPIPKTTNVTAPTITYFLLFSIVLFDRLFLPSDPVRSGLFRFNPVSFKLSLGCLYKVVVVKQICSKNSNVPIHDNILLRLPPSSTPPHPPLSDYNRWQYNELFQFIFMVFQTSVIQSTRWKIQTCMLSTNRPRKLSYGEITC